MQRWSTRGVRTQQGWRVGAHSTSCTSRTLQGLHGYLQDAGEALPLVRAGLAQVEGARHVGRAAVVLPACAARPPVTEGKGARRMGRHESDGWHCLYIGTGLSNFEAQARAHLHVSYMHVTLSAL